MTNKLFSINLNFDSLGEAYGWPKDFKDDNAFLVGMDRILNLGNKLNIPITFFLVGKDLENKKNFDLVKRLSNNNNIEIANHSYNHLFNFGSRNEKVIHDEIYKSHELIFKCTGKESKGFISPTWSISKNTIKNLIKLNYAYDTSYFKSIYLYPAVLKIFLSHIFKNKFKKAFQILNRRDYLIPFTNQKDPFFIDSDMNINPKNTSNTILEMPMPTINKYTPPVWHTAGYVFGWEYLKKNLQKILNLDKPFFYLIHPADFLDENDMNGKYKLALERMKQISFEKKIYYLQDVLEYIINNGYRGVKLIEIAKYYGANDN